MTAARECGARLANHHHQAHAPIETETTVIRDSGKRDYDLPRKRWYQVGL